jgi:hypothetical protein
MEIIYTAFFVDDPAKLLSMFPPKHAHIFAHHSTNIFKPKSGDRIAVGNKVPLKILGRAHDKKGDALLIENTFSQNKFPHITLSCADGVPPRYSDELLASAHTNHTLELFAEPCFIEATEGYFTSDGNVVIA